VRFPLHFRLQPQQLMCPRLCSMCSKLLWIDLLVGSANLLNCCCVNW
jgi:hypothetical protein